MRWRSGNFGDKRIIKRFALFPICCLNDEVAWLETVFIEQHYLTYGWTNIRFLTPTEPDRKMPERIPPASIPPRPKIEPLG